MAKRLKKPRVKGAAVVYGIRTARGEKMLKGPWKLVSPHWLEFPATLIGTINIGKTRRRGSTTVLHQPLIEPDDVKWRLAGQGSATVLNCAAKADIVRAAALCRVVR